MQIIICYFPKNISLLHFFKSISKMPRRSTDNNNERPAFRFATPLVAEEWRASTAPPVFRRTTVRDASETTSPLLETGRELEDSDEENIRDSRETNANRVHWKEPIIWVFL